MEERKKIGEEELFELIDRDKNNKVDFKEMLAYCEESKYVACQNLSFLLRKAVHRKEEWNTSELVKSLTFPTLKHHIRNNNVEIVAQEDHTFVMVSDSLEKLNSKMPALHTNRFKFVCFNDNIDPSSPDFQAIRQTIRQFYEFKFPEKSSFEL